MALFGRAPRSRPLSVCPVQDWVDRRPLPLGSTNGRYQLEGRIELGFESSG